MRRTLPLPSRCYSNFAKELLPRDSVVLKRKFIANFSISPLRKHRRRVNICRERFGRFRPGHALTGRVAKSRRDTGTRETGARYVARSYAGAVGYAL